MTQASPKEFQLNLQHQLLNPRRKKHKSANGSPNHQLRKRNPPPKHKTSGTQPLRSKMNGIQSKVKLKLNRSPYHRYPTRSHRRQSHQTRSPLCLERVALIHSQRGQQLQPSLPSSQLPQKSKSRNPISKRQRSQSRSSTTTRWSRMRSSRTRMKMISSDKFDYIY